MVAVVAVIVVVVAPPSLLYELTIEFLLLNNTRVADIDHTRWFNIFSLKIFLFSNFRF